MELAVLYQLALRGVPELLMSLSSFQLFERVGVLPRVTTVSVETLGSPGGDPAQTVLGSIVQDEVVGELAADYQLLQVGILIYLWCAAGYDLEGYALG